MGVNVKKISDEIKAKEWMMKIQSCRESGMSVRKWCKENGVNEATYYVWLKKLRTYAVESGIVEAPKFIPVPVDEIKHSETKNQEIVISKGDVHIHIPNSIDAVMINHLISALL